MIRYDDGAEETSHHIRLKQSYNKTQPPSLSELYTSVSMLMFVKQGYQTQFH